MNKPAGATAPKPGPHRRAEEKKLQEKKVPMPGASGVVTNTKAKYQGQTSHNPASRAPAQRIPAGAQPKPGGDGDVLTEYEKMIFAQEFEEDDSERLAQQL